MRMQKRIWLYVLAIGVLMGWLGSRALADDKANATGTWKSSFTTQNGQTIETTLKLKQDGDKVTVKYKGKVTKDSIKGKVEFERDGQTRSRDWEAKREKS